MNSYKLLRYLDLLIVWFTTAVVLVTTAVGLGLTYGKGPYLLPFSLGALVSIIGVLCNYINIRQELDV